MRMAKTITNMVRNALTLSQSNEKQPKARGSYLSFAVLATLLGAPTVSAGDERGFIQEVITLRADDRVSVPAVLTYPSAGINTHSPAVIYHHGGPGGSPVQGLGAPRFIAERLAAKGYTGLSILSRHSTGHRNIPIEKATLDVKAAADWLSQMGMTDIVLVGHSLGSIRITRYWIDTRDPRIKAMIHYAPTRDLPQWVRAGMGAERYDEIVARLSQMVSEGRGDEYVFDPFQMPPPAPPGIERGFLQTAATWLNWWGPAAQTRNSVWLAQLDMPLLLVSGDADVFVTKDYQDALQAAAVNSPRVDTLWYEGGVDHVFTSGAERAARGSADWHEGVGLADQPGATAQSAETTETAAEAQVGMSVRDRAAQDAYDWLGEIGLAPRPRVRTRLVDARATDGVKQSGVLYEPEAGRGSSRTAFMVLYGYSGDVMRSSSHWLPVRLAQAGYTALAARNRAAGAAIYQSVFEDVAKDTAGWVNYLEGQGFDRVILVGHSWGGIRATYYKVSSGDPRVVGIVYLAPTQDGPDWAERGLGKAAYDSLVAQAQAMVAAGDGSRRMVFAQGVVPEPAPSGMTRQWHQSARSFLSEWGPEAATVHTQQIKKLDIPILAIAGNKDTFVDLPFMKRFTRAAGGPADYQWYDDGAPHSLIGWEDRVSEDILGWLQARILQTD